MRHVAVHESSYNHITAVSSSPCISMDIAIQASGIGFSNTCINIEPPFTAQQCQPPDSVLA